MSGRNTAFGREKRTDPGGYICLCKSDSGADGRDHLSGDDESRSI